MHAFLCNLSTGCARTQCGLGCGDQNAKRDSKDDALVLCLCVFLRFHDESSFHCITEPLTTKFTVGRGT